MDVLSLLALAVGGGALAWSIRLGARHEAPGLWLLGALVACGGLFGGLRAAGGAGQHAARELSWDALWGPTWESAAALALSLLGLGALARVDRVLTRESRARRASERHLRAALDGSPDAVWTVDPTGRTTYVNPALARLLRREEAELLGSNLLDHVASTHRDRARRDLLDPLPGDAPTLQEVPLLRADGRAVWTRFSSCGLDDEAGRLAGARVTITDLTPTRRAEVQRRGRDRVLEQIARDEPLERVLEAICTTTQLAFPGSWLGVQRADASGEGSAFVTGPDFPARLREAVRSLPLGAELGAPPDAAPRLRTRVSADTHSDPAWAAYRGLAEECGVRAAWSTPIRSSADAPLGVLWACHDAPCTPDEGDLEYLHGSARLAAIAIENDHTRRELERSRAMLLAAIEQSPAGIAIADAREGRVRVANSRALGVSRGAHLESPDVRIDELPLGWECLHPDGSHLLPEDLPLRRAIEKGRTTRNQEMLLRRGDGLKRWVLASAAPVRDSHGTITAGVLVLLDISERKRDDRDMARLLRILGERKEELESIFRATSHDLRAPLVNIDGFARELELACGELRRLLHHSSLDPDLAAELRPLLDVEIPLDLDYIRGSAQRMEQLLASLRRLIGVDRLELRIETIDTGELVRQVLWGFEFQLREDEFEVALGALPPCRADRDALEQILSNLVDNAIKYRDPARPGVLRIQGRVREGRSHYVVADAGIGIPAEVRDRIFSPFRRHAPAGVPGDGLGLAILGRLLARMSGRVRVDSEVGVGSTFEFSLPAVLANAVAEDLLREGHPRGEAPAAGSRITGGLVPEGRAVPRGPASGDAADAAAGRRRAEEA